MKNWCLITALIGTLLVGLPSIQAGEESYETNDWIGHADVEGGKDVAGISRFQGAILQYYKVMKWDKYTLPVSRLLSVGGGKEWKDPLHLEGKITRVQYSVNGENNPAFVNQNYLKALTDAGWEILFRGCGDDELGNDSTEWCFYYYGNEGFDNGRFGSAFDPRGDNHCYLAARHDDALHTYYAAIYTVDFEEESKGLAFTLITEDVIEIQKAQTGLVTADKLTDGLNANGHVAVYGIYFDTGKADLEPSSSGALEQIAALLEQQPGLNLYVVGHTDDSGEYGANMTLSKARADAVVRELVEHHHVSASRLQAAGVGPLSPVAANETSDGRALNRRVELVKSHHRAAAATTPRPSAPPSRSRAAGVPEFEVKQDAVLAASGQAGTTPQEAAQPATPAASPAQPKPPKLVPVPSVIGKFKVFAVKSLEQQGFRVAVRGKKVGRVSAQSPAANSKVAPGTLITITIGG